MADMLYEQVMKPRYAPCETLVGPFEKTFMDYDGYAFHFHEFED